MLFPAGVYDPLKYDWVRAKMRRKIVWLVVCCLMALALLATSCAKAEEKAALALENTTWVLELYGESGKLQSVLPDAEVTALFDSAKGQVTGSAGVNRYGGAYKLDGNKLIISGIVLTAMAGPQPLMDQETEFLTLLQAAESYKIDGDKLTITCGGKVLIFTKK